MGNKLQTHMTRDLECQNKVNIEKNSINSNLILFPATLIKASCQFSDKRGASHEQAVAS